MSPLAFIVADLIILWSGWDTDWKLGVAILIGYVILVDQPGLPPQRPPAGAELEVGAVAACLPRRHGRDRVRELVRARGLTRRCGGTSPWSPRLSLIIYYWAMAVGLPREEIEEMVEEVVLPEEEGLEMPTH